MDSRELHLKDMHMRRVLHSGSDLTGMQAAVVLPLAFCTAGGGTQSITSPIHHRQHLSAPAEDACVAPQALSEGGGSGLEVPGAQFLPSDGLFPGVDTLPAETDLGELLSPSYDL